MLSEQIYTGQGKRTARRVLDTQPFTVEVSFEDKGMLLGLEGGSGWLDLRGGLSGQRLPQSRPS